MDLAVARDEVGALDQDEAEIAGEIGLFVIGLAVGAGRMQADARIGAVGQSGEAGLEFLEEGREAPHVQLAIDVLEGARQVEAAFQRIAQARRRLGAIVQDPPLAVRPAADIGGVKAQISAAGRAHADHRMEEIGAAGHRRGGQHAAGDQFGLAVKIGEQALENFGALGDAGFDHRPVLLGDQQRQMAERPGAVHRFAIGAIGDALFADIALDGLETPRDILAAKLRELGEKLQPMAARASVGADELVRNADERPIGRGHLHQSFRLGFRRAHRRRSRHRSP